MKGNVKVILAGKEYTGIITGVRQDVEELGRWNSDDSEFIPGRAYCEFTFGGNTVEIPVDYEQFKILMNEI